MKIAFMMDRLEEIDPVWETTSHLMYESNQRGHTVYFLEPHDIYIRKNNVMARMYDISVDADQSMKQYWRAAIRFLKSPKAIFTTRTLTTPIVPQKQWQSIAEAAKKKDKPLAALLNHPITHPIGCGPFVLKEWRQGTCLHLEKNRFIRNQRTFLYFIDIKGVYANQP